ncbi:hypothetical protein [Achromobacter denitrificans]|uniref:hypothetical protein n=1 Tax=Achromobacter denitrificans TaxID=32002 RepID=UPI003BA224AC
MKNTTQAPKGQGCVVLTHPRFDRPKVENPRHPGPKRGCASFAKAKIKRMRQQLEAGPQADVTVPALSNCVTRLADFVQIVFKVDTSTAYRVASVAGGEFVRQQAGGAA